MQGGRTSAHSAGRTTKEGSRCCPPSAAFSGGPRPLDAAADPLDSLGPALRLKALQFNMGFPDAS